MARLRYNNKLGLLGAALGSNPATDTTITFVSDPGFATLAAGDYIPIVLEPPSGSTPGANFEVVWLTAFNSGSPLTGTISRAMEGTACVAHLIGMPWQCAPTRLDLASRQEVHLDARNLLSEPFPQTMCAATQAISSTRVFAVLTPFLEGDVITGIACIVRTAGAGANPASIVFGVVSLANVVQQQTANVAANAGFLVAQNPVLNPLGAPFIIPASGDYWLVAWASGTWVTTQMLLLAGPANVGMAINGGPPPVATITTAAFPANGAGIGTLAGPTNAIPIWLGAY